MSAEDESKNPKLQMNPDPQVTASPGDEDEDVWRPDWTTEELDEELKSDRPENLFASEITADQEAEEAREASAESDEGTAFDSIEASPLAAAAAEKREAASAHEGLMHWDEALTLEGQVEAVLFAAPKPLSLTELADILQDEDGQPTAGEIERIVQQLSKLYRERNGGFRLEHDKGSGYQFRTVPAAAPLMERMFASRQRPLSRAALETLAIIAYRQPATRADIEYIRGVDAGSIIKNLLERDLIACVGRKEDAGRPMMFATSAEFLRVFRIQSLDQLPPLSAFQPAPDMMAEAMNRLEEGGAEVDVESFIEDPLEADHEVSEGLILEPTSDDFAAYAKAFQVRVSDTQSDPQPSRSGASFDAEGSDQDDRRDEDQDPKMAFSARSGVAPRSREDVGGGKDFDQRPREQGDGDED